MLHINNVFDNLNDDDKIVYIANNPEKLLLLDKEEVKAIERMKTYSKEYIMLQRLKRSAIKNCGSLILVFEENGFKINNQLIRMAFKAEPSIGKFCPSEWFTSRSIRTMLKDDLNNYNYIPKEWFSGEDKKSNRMIDFLQRRIRETVAYNEKSYFSLPADILTGERTAYSALNAYTNDGREINALRVSPKLWESNGGKIMFKIARANLDIALKMLDYSQRESLAVALLEEDYLSYKKFPKSLKENKNVRFKLFEEAMNNADTETVNQYFNDDFDYYLKRFRTAGKRRNTIEINKKTGNNVKTTRKPKAKKGQQCLFTDEELKALEK